MATTSTNTPTGRALAAEVARRLPRRLARALLRPAPLLVAAVGTCALVLPAGRGTPPHRLAPATADYAARYITALQTGNTDDVLASLAPEARAGLSVAGRRAFGASADGAERQAGAVLVRSHHMDRATNLARHDTPDGSCVVHAAE